MDVFDKHSPFWSHGSTKSHELAGAHTFVPLIVFKLKQTCLSETQSTKWDWAHGTTVHCDDERYSKLLIEISPEKKYSF